MNLQPFRDAWREKQPAEFAEQQTYEHEWVAPLWLEGFYVHDPTDDGDRYVWGTPDATMILVNPTDRTRTFSIKFLIGTDNHGPFVFTLSGIVDDSYILEHPTAKDERYGVRKEYQVEIPPGRSTIRIRCIPPDYFSSDSRKLCYFVKDFRLEERR
jgi:hypothetical protein